MKRIAFALTLSAVLGACTVGAPSMSVGLGLGTKIGSNIGLGTSINIPVGLDRNRKADSAKGGLNIQEEQIVTYFDAQGNPSNAAVKGGFYRKLVGRQGEKYTVQDFYGDNAQKRSDPYVLTRNRLLDFRAHPDDGELSTYAYNGNRMHRQTYKNKNGRLVATEYNK